MLKSVEKFNNVFILIMGASNLGIGTLLLEELEKWKDYSAGQNKKDNKVYYIREKICLIFWHMKGLNMHYEKRSLELRQIIARLHKLEASRALKTIEFTYR